MNEPVRTSTWVALALIAAGWFWLATLVSTFGPIQQVMHFYDLGTVLRDPSWLVHGMGSSHGAGALAWGAIGVITLLAPLAAHRSSARIAWLLYAAPLVLMLLGAAALYARTTQPYLVTPSGAGSLRTFFSHTANGLLGHVGDSIAAHIRVGAGGYLACAAALYLAVRGIRRARERRTADAPLHGGYPHNRASPQA